MQLPDGSVERVPRRKRGYRGRYAAAPKKPPSGVAERGVNCGIGCAYFDTLRYSRLTYSLSIRRVLNCGAQVAMAAFEMATQRADTPSAL